MGPAIGAAGVLGVVLLAVAAVGGARAAAPSHPVALHGDAVWAPGSKRAPDFRLADQDGRQISLHALRGRVVLLTFLDSLCTKDCPIEGGELRDVQRALGDTARPELVVVSVDPADRPATARAFIAKAGLTGGWRWHWLMGTEAQLAPVWRAYDVTVLGQRGDIAHSTVLYLLDAGGYQRAGYLYPFLTGVVVPDVRALAAPSRRTWP